MPIACSAYRQCGERAVRVDILERLADLIRPALAWRESSPGEKPTGAFDGRGFVVTQAMTSLTGSAGEDFASILRALGYRMDKRPPLPPKPAPEVVVETVAAETPPVEASAEVVAEMPAEDVAAEVPADTSEAASSASLLPNVTPVVAEGLKRSSCAPEPPSKPRRTRLREARCAKRLRNSG
jgi:ATP-dependent RNA helicase SUPV3L1/SUV3